MKPVLLLIAVILLTSFKPRSLDNEIDGIWVGYYKSDFIKEKVIIKFTASKQMEFYTGGVDDRTRCIATYLLHKDSIQFTYRTPEGKEVQMNGRLNSRKTYVSGSWNGENKLVGNFYLARQKVEERSL